MSFRSFIALGDSFAQLRQIARRHDCLHVDLWSMKVLADAREWCPDLLPL